MPDWVAFRKNATKKGRRDGDATLPLSESLYTEHRVVLSSLHNHLDLRHGFLYLQYHSRHWHYGLFASSLEGHRYDSLCSPRKASLLSGILALHKRSLLHGEGILVLHGGYLLRGQGVLTIYKKFPLSAKGIFALHIRSLLPPKGIFVLQTGSLLSDKGVLILYRESALRKKRLCLAQRISTTRRSRPCPPHKISVLHKSIFSLHIRVPTYSP